MHVLYPFDKLVKQSSEGNNDLLSHVKSCR
jgi:hypothetical protein